MTDAWQAQLAKLSLKKRAKFAALASALPTRLDGLDCLEVGCGPGSSAVFLESLGGRWLHADPDPARLAEASALLGGRTVPMTESAVPNQPDEAFDLVVAVDLLEHLADEQPLLAELRRLLRPGGRLVVTTPRLRPFAPPAVLRKIFGLRPAVFGHHRDGYTPERLESLIAAAGFEVTGRRVFLGPVTSTIETVADAAYYWLFGRWRDRGQWSGGSQIAPASDAEFRRHRLAVGLYRTAVPLLRLIGGIDKLLPRGKGFGLLVEATKHLAP